MSTARNFSGTSQYITAGRIPISGSASIHCWFKAGTFNYSGNDASIAGIFAKGQWGGDADGDLRITIAGANIAAQVRTSTSDYSATWATSNLSTGTWYTADAVYDEAGTTVYLYVNGVQRATATTAGTMANGTNTTAIGGYPNNETNTEFQGDIAECAAWDVALSAAECLALYNDSATVAATQSGSLAFYLPLGVASPEDDQGPNNLDGTVVGATVTTGPPIGGGSVTVKTLAALGVG